MSTSTHAARSAPRAAPFIRPLLDRLGRQFRTGSLAITLPGGDTLTWQGTEDPGTAATWRIADYGVLSALASRGPIALGETYREGRWDTDDLVRLLVVLARNEPHLSTRLPRLSFARMLDRVVLRMRRNTRRQAARNIHAHYDLGNAFYEAWLDDTMTYSAARFEPGGRETLAAAQRRKYRELADATDLKSGHHVLEIGCGWGGFAEFAATEIGCRVTAITISREQYEYAKARMMRAGIDDRVDVRYLDYRDLASEAPASFDRAISIEMFEAVGEQYWHEYADTVMSLIKPGGRAGLQVITVDETRFEAYRSTPDFIQRYVFPGGMLPSPERLTALFSDTGATGGSVAAFGRDYARTLAAWERRFNEEWSRVRALGFDEPFRRFWSYYLAHCQAGFLLGWTDVHHFVFTRP